MITSNLGQYLRKLRKAKKETLHQVSKEVDIDSPMISKIERGERLPTFDQIRRFSQYFGVSEVSLKEMRIAEKILKEYGFNDTTYNAIQIVNRQLTTHFNENKQL